MKPRSESNTTDKAKKAALIDNRQQMADVVGQQGRTRLTFLRTGLKVVH